MILISSQMLRHGKFVHFFSPRKTQPYDYQKSQEKRHYDNQKVQENLQAEKLNEQKKRFQEELAILKKNVNLPEDFDQICNTSVMGEKSIPREILLKNPPK